MSWEKVKLGDLYEVHNGLSKGGKFFGSGYPFLSFSTVFNNWFIPQKIKDLVQSTDKEQESYSIKKGDVFITRTSETADELGMSCVALKDYPQATYNGFCKRLRPIKSNYEVNPRYIGYYLRTSDFRGKFLGLSGTMTTRASLRNEDLLAMEILLPPLKEQKRIADILSAYDDLIKTNQKQIKLLEEAAQRLYKEWFVDLRFPGHEDTRIVDGVPEGWRKVQLSECCIILRRGISPKYNEKGKYLVINQKCIRSSIMDMSESRRQENDYPEELNIRDTDTVICSTGTGTLGRVGKVYGEHENTTFDSHVTLVRACKNCNFIYQVIKDREPFLMRMGRGSTNQQELYKGVIETIELLVPPDEILIRFENMVSDIHKKTTVLVGQIERLIYARDRLLPKLMNGKIDI